MLLAALFAAPAYAQETGASCARIEDDPQRLACYDGVFRSDAGEGDAGGLTIQSERLIPALPSGREPAEMVVQCEAGTLSVLFRFAGQQVSVTGDIAPVTFQVDQGATLVRTLRVSQDNAAVGFWTTGESSAFIDSLAGGTNLKVRMTPVRQRSLTVDFRLAQHLGTITEIRDTCR
jgi:hypothetical protein